MLRFDPLLVTSMALSLTFIPTSHCPPPKGLTWSFYYVNSLPFLSLDLIYMYNIMAARALRYVQSPQRLPHVGPLLDFILIPPHIFIHPTLSIYEVLKRKTWIRWVGRHKEERVNHARTTLLVLSHLHCLSSQSIQTLWFWLMVPSMSCLWSGSFPCSVMLILLQSPLTGSPGEACCGQSS